MPGEKLLRPQNKQTQASGASKTASLHHLHPKMNALLSLLLLFRAPASFAAPSKQTLELAARQESSNYYTAPCLPTSLGDNVPLCCDSSTYSISDSYLGYNVASCQDDNFGNCLSQYVSDVCVWAFPLGTSDQEGSTAGCGASYSQYAAADLSDGNYCNIDGSLNTLPSSGSGDSSSSSSSAAAVGTHKHIQEVAAMAVVMMTCILFL